MRWYLFQMAVAILIGWVCIASGAAEINGFGVGVLMLGGSLAVTGLASLAIDLIAKLRGRTRHEQ